MSEEVLICDKDEKPIAVVPRRFALDIIKQDHNQEKILIKDVSANVNQ